jgi:capsular polysaccharide biosynthesis protein
VTVGEVYGALWRRRFFILLLTACLVAVDAFLTARETKQYTASTLVRVEQVGTSPADQYGSLQTGALLAETYARIAQTSSVAKAVRQDLGNRIPLSAIKIKGEQISNIELLTLSVTNPNPALAARIANAVPAALAEVVKSGATKSPDVITTVEEASTPTSPSSPNIKLNIALGVIVGLILNAAVVLLAAAFADRVGSPEDVERVAGHPVVATIPNLVLTPATEIPSNVVRAQRPPPRTPAQVRSKRQAQDA